jgi:hypothetical protein
MCPKMPTALQSFRGGHTAFSYRYGFEGGELPKHNIHYVSMTTESQTLAHWLGRLRSL